MGKPVVGSCGVTGRGHFKHQRMLTLFPIFQLRPGCPSGLLSPWTAARAKLDFTFIKPSSRQGGGTRLCRWGEMSSLFLPRLLTKRETKSA